MVAAAGSVKRRGGSLQLRERLLDGGADLLTDVELLAAVLGTGVAGVPAPALAERLMVRFGGLSGLLDSAPATLLSEPGLGPARVALLKALRALVERCHLEVLEAGPVFDSSAAVRGFLRGRLACAPRELFGCLFLDSRHRLVSFEVLFSGTVDRATVHPREILRRALELNAAAVILAHNHPSGVAEPSVSDVALTERLKDLLAHIDVRLLDHLVVGRGEEVSLAERGLL